MRPVVQFFGFVVLAACLLPALVGCHKTQARAPHAAATPGSTSAVVPKDDGWRQRAAVVSVDPGNALTQRRSESHFTPRTSRASVDSNTSSLVIQVAALNHLVSVNKPLIEQQLRELGLHVVAVRQSKLRKPNDFNVLVEDVIYVEELERKHDWDPVVYTMTPAIHVRVITANERNTFEASPITVRSYGQLTPKAAEDYGRKLAMARVNLGKRLVEWLDARLERSPATPTTETAKKQAPKLSPSSKPKAQSAKSLGRFATPNRHGLSS